MGASTSVLVYFYCKALVKILVDFKFRLERETKRSLVPLCYQAVGASYNTNPRYYYILSLFYQLMLPVATAHYIMYAVRFVYNYKELPLFNSIHPKPFGLF